MIGRTLAIAMNTYREAVRARVLLGLLATAVGVSLYSLVIASMSVRQESRIVADLGSASISLLSVLTAIILGATSLYRELELKTVFPILTRKLRRHEYVVGKFLGIVSTLVVFVAIDGAVVLTIIAVQSSTHVTLTVSVAAVLAAVLGILLVRAKHTRVFVLLPWSIAAFAAAALVADGAGPERQVVLVSSALTVAEIVIVCAVAMLFSSFSSPYLTAMFTVMIVLIGRSTDTLGNLPARMFGESGRAIGMVLARVFPNLFLYVPSRPVLLGQVPSVSLPHYVATAWGNALLYAAVLLVASGVVFRRRDFQ
jgi:ABC-type transport system involved in multi-copper enzyme maturation permease subunit